MGKKSRLLSTWTKETKHRFDANNRIESFDEYMQDLAAAPYFLTRSAPRYILDMMEYFGQEESSSFGNNIQRFKLFDADFGLEAQDEQPLFGQEEPAEAIYKALENLSTEGRADRLIHLHGPNGSSKSLIIELLMRGCEAYSTTHEGALYTLSWVFPREAEPVTMGFGAKDEAAGNKVDRDRESYAHLPSELVQAELQCELGDNPILLIPKIYRMEVLENLLEKAPDEQRKNFVRSSFLTDGDLCPRCRMIYDALLEEYRGDVSSLLRHVRVRRNYLSRRYRRGAVVISPQETPDAGSRQITLDSSLQNLPNALQHLALTQLYGDLVDANNGLIEFSDFLTRAPELNKYLLTAAEKGEVTLNTANVYLNLVLFATSNERHLDAFKESPDFASFKGRSILVSVPYLLERKKEQGIYDAILERIGHSKHISPHVAGIASLFAILTRLHRPSAEHYPETLRELATGLAPIEKASLYDGELPSSNGRYTPRQMRSLRELLPLLKEEYMDTPIYEGRFGASPRELREVLYNAAFRHNEHCLTPIDLFEELEDLVKDKSLYLFLQLKPDEGYHDASKTVESLKSEYTKIVEKEVMESMVLVPEGHYAEMFKRYFSNVKASLRGEKVEEPVTGERTQPDEEFMSEIEGYLAVDGDPREFREELLAQVAAWTLESPEQTLDLEELFSLHLAKLAKGFAENNSSKVETIGRALLAIGTPDFEIFTEADRKLARQALDHLATNYGYCPKCAPRMVDFFLTRRFSK